MPLATITLKSHWILINPSLLSILLDYAISVMLNVSYLYLFYLSILLILLLIVSVLLRYRSLVDYPSLTLNAIYYYRIYNTFDSCSNFLIPPFKYFFNLLSSLYIIFSLTLIESLSGLYASYSLYHIHYFSSIISCVILLSLIFILC